jgi:putative intracellular protease/amidase
MSGFTNDEESVCGMMDHLPKHEGGLQTCEDLLAARGGNYSKADAWSSHVAGAGTRLLTGQNPASASAVGEAIVAALAWAIYCEMLHSTN